MIYQYACGMALCMFSKGGGLLRTQCGEQRARISAAIVRGFSSGGLRIATAKIPVTALKFGSSVPAVPHQRQKDVLDEDFDEAKVYLQDALKASSNFCDAASLGTLSSHKKAIGLPVQAAKYGFSQWINGFALKNKPQYIVNVEQLQQCRDPIVFRRHSPNVSDAYHFPSQVLPISAAFKVPPQIHIDPLVPEVRVSGKTARVPLENYVLGRASVLFFWNAFCGPEPVRLWKRSVISDASAPESFKTKLHYLHVYSELGHSQFLGAMLVRLKSRKNLIMSITPDFSAEGPFLPGALEANLQNQGNAVLTSSLNCEAQKRLHLYNPFLCTVVLVDEKGFIRWHAVGNPTAEAAIVLRRSIRRILRE